MKHIKGFPVTLMILFLSYTCVQAQTVSHLKAMFSDCHIIVTFDLEVCEQTDLILLYSGDGGNTWLPCNSVTGDITNQITGKKTIIWDNQSENIWGKFTFKIEALRPLNCCRVKSSLPVGELTFMCYNLGANENMSLEGQMAYAPTNNFDPTVYGDFYQWGRFTDGHEKRNSSTTTILSSTDMPGHSNFIASPSHPSDWRNPQNPSLWDATKTANDPCPEGWRVPTLEEWASICDNAWIWNSIGTPGYKISSDGGITYTLFLPASGFRWDTSGALTNVGSNGRYWCSTVAYSGSYSLSFDNNSMSPPVVGGSYFSRSAGISVRCVKEY